MYGSETGCMDFPQGHACFVVGSPLQLLNAIEARQRFHDGQFCTLIVLWAHEFDHKQMLKLLDDQWSRKIFFNTRGFFKLFYPIFLKSVVSDLKGIDCLYLGFPFKIRAHIANEVNAKKNLILDDGNGSLTIAVSLKDEHFLTKIKPKLHDYILGRKISVDYAKTATFFTLYPDMAWPRDQVIANDYRMLRQQIARQPTNLDVLFVGSAVAGAVVSVAQEKQLIEAMAVYYAGQQVIYALHRFEDQAYFEREFAHTSLRFVRFDTAIEVALCQAQVYPQRIASFCSSALTTLSLLYGGQTEVLAIPSAWMAADVAARLDVIYQDFARSGIHIRHFLEEQSHVA
jgi:hypothetical protein